MDDSAAFGDAIARTFGDIDTGCLCHADGDPDCLSCYHPDPDCHTLHFGLRDASVPDSLRSAFANANGDTAY